MIVGPPGCKTVGKEMKTRKVYKFWQKDGRSKERFLSLMIYKFCTFNDNIIYRIEKSRGAGLESSEQNLEQFRLEVLTDLQVEVQ